MDCRNNTNNIGNWDCKEWPSEEYLYQGMEVDDFKQAIEEIRKRHSDFNQRNKEPKEPSSLAVLNFEKWHDESYDLTEVSPSGFRSGRVKIKPNPVRGFHNLKIRWFYIVFDVTDAVILR